MGPFAANGEPHIETLTQPRCCSGVHLQAVSGRFTAPQATIIIEGKRMIQILSLQIVAVGIVNRGEWLGSLLYVFIHFFNRDGAQVFSFAIVLP